ncbi:DUF5924 family protein [Pokkaliibacter sp. CJK22405]|uniref:DUF5924 family protein n=1 Tax=Pokkaliibacter sp. CJK22405 TaxID=3384615 RepID=UPI003984F4EC
MIAQSREWLQHWIAKGAAIIQRFPRLIALFGFVSGIASFFLVDRQHGAGKIMAVVMIVTWLWLMLENILTQTLAKRFGLFLPPPLLRYVTQLIHQESLFFVLPFFAITTSWNSGQAVFTGLLGAAALISIIDPLYYHWLSTKRALFLAYHNLALFAVMLTALPLIVHLNTAESYLLALVMTLLVSLPSRLVSIPITSPRRWLMALSMTAVVGIAGVVLRPWVPPATLWMNQVAITTSMNNDRRDPGKGIKSLTESELRQQGLYAFTAINAPQGLDEKVFHVWKHEGHTVDRIALEIHGGRKQGYRAWTHKSNFPEDVKGKWKVQVVTEGGQIIGTLRFEVR